MLFNNGSYGQDIVMAFSPPKYCRLFAQKKAYQGGVTGTPGPPPSYAPAHEIRGTNFWDIMHKWSLDTITQSFCEKKDIYIK